MAPAFTDQFTNNVETESEAMSVINALRHKFGLVGTEFCEEDIRGYVHSSLGNHDKPAIDFLEPHIIRAVQEDSRWSHLNDGMIERGNDGIQDIVEGISESVSVGLSTMDNTVIVFAFGEQGVVLRETKLSDDEELLGEIALAQAVPGVREVKVGRLSTFGHPHGNLLTIS